MKYLSKCISYWHTYKQYCEIPHIWSELSTPYFWYVLFSPWSKLSRKALTIRFKSFIQTRSSCQSLMQ